ncbi:MAG: UDP-N-acetylmuramoyl-L-alanyl-D-glutamate--2,6-diaminopimelate ligase [Betaproteobacteria bacterium]|nr:UDP-N-acetylmuramoyl-L-alanyl-D-glutamate--2,6-diaminopimelate ligase [Betaproteobacteria bacterium]
MRHLQTPEQAAHWLSGLVQGQLQSDNRRVRSGDAFFAWVGQSTDARHHVVQALQQGASACLVEAQGLEAFEAVNDLALHDAPIGSVDQLKAASGWIADAFHGHPSHQLKMLAVTGTNGKTSTAWWLSQALTRLGERCTVVGTLGLGEPGHMLSTGLTTPDPLVLHAQLKDWLHAGVKACAIEASSIGIQEKRLAGVHLRTAIFTNFSQDHLDYHKSMDAYWQAKQSLFEWPGLQAAVINIDDPKGLNLFEHLQRVGQCKLLTVSMRDQADLVAAHIQRNPQGLSFDVVEGADLQTVHMNAMGEFNVMNLLGVIATLRDLGYSLASAAKACSGLQDVPGRMQRLGKPDQPALVIDYAHTPHAIEQVLQALRPWVAAGQGRLICVLGCGGNRDISKRAPMARMAEMHADLVCLTSDNPRTEDPLRILAHMREGLQHPDKVIQEPDRAKAIARMVAMANARDMVLIAGKGHETYQEIQGVKHGFSDMDHAVLALHHWGRA